MRLEVLLLTLAYWINACVGDIVVENDLIVQKEIYDFVYAEDSDVWWQTPNATSYNCIFRNLWTPERHPRDYPELARWSPLALYSGTKDFRPWLKNQVVTLGVEKLAETGYMDGFQNDIIQAGERVYDYSESSGFFVNGADHIFFPPIHVSFDYPFLNAIGAIQPSPDWYSGFYLFDTVDEYDRTYWQRFTLRTYPWDAGTDAGQSYTAVDFDLDPPVNAVRVYAESASSSGAFVSPDGTQVLPVGEFDCVLHTCPTEDPDCARDDWPPVNQCDILKFPGCASYCQVGLDSICELCIGNALESVAVYIGVRDCCEAGHDPVFGVTCAERALTAAPTPASPQTHAPTTAVPAPTPVTAVPATVAPTKPSSRSPMTPSPTTGAPGPVPTSVVPSSAPPTASPTASTASAQESVTSMASAAGTNLALLVSWASVVLC